MSNALTSIYRTMSADTDLVKLIADNIANAQVSGYQRKFAIQEADFAALQSQAGQPAQRTGSALHIGTDSTPGTLTETGEPLDVALNGAGSFVAMSESGEQQVRGGRFHIDDQGFLVTQSGAQLLGVSGSLNVSGAAVDLSKFKISADGTVVSNGTELGQLLVRAASDDEHATVPQVMQGYMETSNVNAVTEMLKLMDVIRHFEAAQRVAKTFSDLQQQGIADIGKI